MLALDEVAEGAVVLGLAELAELAELVEPAEIVLSTELLDASALPWTQPRNSGAQPYPGGHPHE